jgi:hypothetical protein
MFTLLRDEKSVSGLLVANVSLEGVAHFMVKLAPILGALLTLLQILVAAATLWHFVLKWRLKFKKHEEKSVTPPDTTASDI